MKKMTLALIALFAVVANGLDARCGRGNCAPKACEQKCETSCTPIPECFQWRKVAVCPEKHVEVTYTCPAGSNEGSAVCNEQEKINGGRAY